MPASWPSIPAASIAGFAGKPFAEVAAALLMPYLGGALAAADVRAITKDAYARFDHAAVTPLRQIDHRLWVLELFHGPTLAFKDLAMQVLARLMDHVLAARGGRVTLVAATSGDTGGAAIEAFRGSKRITAVVLLPRGRISEVQRRMMTTTGEPNVHALAIEGTFDDCQALVKAMFNDLASRSGMWLAAFISINWARTVAQLTYSLVPASAPGGPTRQIAFSAPTGNFGDVFASDAAKAMGLPAQRLIIATNENDILQRAWSTGTYALADVLATTSPSMDIQVSSNFERFLFEASGRDAAFVRGKMAALQQSRAIELEAAAAQIGRAHV